MLWSRSGRWSTHQAHLTSHRFLVLNHYSPRSCKLMSFWTARRGLLSAPASLFPRQVASPTSTVRRPSRGHKQGRELSTETHENERESAHSPPEALPLPKDLRVWLKKHCISELSCESVRQHIIRKQDWLKFLNDPESVVHSAQNLAISELPQQALYLLQAAHSVGLAFKPNVYERVVYQLTLVKEWNLVLSVISAGLDATGKTTVRLLNWRGRALVEVKDFAKLDGLLGEFASHGLNPNRRAFLLIMQGHLLNQDLARAKATIQDMERAGFRLDASTYTVIIPAYKGFGMDSFVLNQGYDVLKNHAPRGKEKVLNGLLRLYLDKHDLEGALRLLETFGSQPENSEADDIHTEFESKNHVATVKDSHRRRVDLTDRATYTILINYLSAYSHRSKSLNGILKRIRVDGRAPDVRVGASLVRMYYARGDEHEALVVLCDCCRPYKLPANVLKSLGYDPHSPGPSVFAPFVGRPTAELFNRVLQGAIQIRGLAATIPVLKLMKRVRVVPDSQTMEVFLWYLAKERLVITEDVVNAMQELLSHNVQPTLKALNIILGSIVRSAKVAKHKEGWNALAGYVKQAVNYLESSDSEELSPREETQPVPSFDQDLCVTDLQSTVFRVMLQPIVQKLSRRRVMADRATFALRMRYDSFTLPPDIAAESAAQKMQVMRDRGLHPNVYHYAALMEAHCNAGDINAAHKVLQNAMASGRVPEQRSQVIMYTILISTHARAGRPDLALSVFKEMLKANVAPDVASVDSLIGAFFAVTAFRLARRVLLDLWPMVAPFPTELCDAPLIDLIARLRDIRSRAEAPNPDIEKPVYNKPELLALINEIISEWAAVEKTRGGDGPGDDFADADVSSIASDDGQDAETQRTDALIV